MLRLRPYRLEDEAAALAADEALRADHFPFLLKSPERSWPDFVADQLDHRCGRALPADWPPGTQLAAVDDGVLVGRVSLRFALANAFLLEHGGHVGYAVVPAWRGRGYATAMLAQAIVVLRSHGVDRVLVTCAADNVASRRVIEKNAGRFERLSGVDGDAGPDRRYWID
jgi:predicted acetyltransferase